MLEMLLKFLGTLVPTMTADPAVQYRYQLRLAATVVAAVLSIVALTASAYGWMPSVSEGFALSSDLKSLVREIRQNRVQGIDQQIIDTKTQQCRAQSDEARALYWSRLSAMMRQYEELTGKAYYLPDCKEL